MSINDLLKEKKITKYRLSKLSGVSQTTINDICSCKVNMKNCTGETLYKLARAFNVTIESLLLESMEKRPSFEIFKSNVCHLLKSMGDLDFIVYVLESDSIRKYYDKKWFPESLYMLAMVDYLCRENDLPICNDYNYLRSARLQKPIYPSGIIVMSSLSNSEQPKIDSLENAIPEFRRFNIVENEVRNVC